VRCTAAGGDGVPVLWLLHAQLRPAVGGTLSNSDPGCLYSRHPRAPGHCCCVAGLQRLVLAVSFGGLVSPLDGVLAPLTQLTALTLTFAGGNAMPVPAGLRLTALRELTWSDGPQPSAHELRSLLAPLTQLTALAAPIRVAGSCGLPELPSLQSLKVDGVAEGGLALLAGACPALVSLTCTGCVTANVTDHAARLPALTRLDFPGARQLDDWVGEGGSLAGCAPALQSVCLGSFHSSPTAVISKLAGLPQLHTFSLMSFRCWSLGARECQALAALPALRSFAASVYLSEASMLACASFCRQLTQLHLCLGAHNDSVQLGACVQFAAAMRMQASRVQVFHLTWSPTVAGNRKLPQLPTPFYQHLASWSCLSHVELGVGCTAEQLSVLCASPSIVHVLVSPARSQFGHDDGRSAALAASVAELMHAHWGRELNIDLKWRVEC